MRAAARSPAADRERPVARPLDAEARRVGRAEHHVLGELAPARGCGAGDARGWRGCLGVILDGAVEPPQQLARELGDAGAGGARGRDHGHLRPHPPRHPASRSARARRSGGPPWTARARRGSARQALVVRGELALDRGVVGGGVRALSLESSGARSSTWTSSRVRSTCARKSCPRPAPSLAPSIRPGMSATTSWRSSRSSTPSTGESVVNG